MIQPSFHRLLGLAVLVGVPALAVGLLGRQARAIEYRAQPRVVSPTAVAAHPAAAEPAVRHAGDALDLTTWQDTAKTSAIRR
ncbi:MAG: hypothetical protein ACJ8F7_16455 [Gemmataceae bacterium]